MIHILFGPYASSSLKVVLKELGLDKKERVISFWEMFSIDPIYWLQEEIGKESRFDWLKNNMNDKYSEFYEYKRRFQKTLNQINY